MRRLAEVAVMQTAFSRLTAPRLVDAPTTPFTALAFRRNVAGLATLRRLDAVTDMIDDALRPADEGTPLPVDIGWLLHLPPHASKVSEEGLRESALHAIDEIRAALALSESVTAAVTGVARNTLASWRRRERNPYPATVRRLFEVHSLVMAAQALHGPTDARRWFYGTSPDGRARRDVLRMPDGVESLASELRHSLFREPSSTLPPPDGDLEEASAEANEYDAAGFRGAIVADDPLL